MSATATAAAFGFHPDPGKNFEKGDEPLIAAALDALAKRKHLNIYGISGARTPAQSAALPGGSANDPHTRGEAADIAVNSQLRATAASLSDADLKSVGLYRPFPGSDEINHVQLLKDSKGKPLITKILDAPTNLGKSIGHTINGLLGLPDPSPSSPLALPAKADEAVDEAVGGAGNAAANKAAQLAADAVRSVFGGFFDQVKSGALKAMLFLLFTVGGLVLAGYGTARLFGVQQPVRSTVGLARKAAVTGALA